jgi:hypothetical protein
MGDYEEVEEIKKPMRFERILQGDIPKGRVGKHKEIIRQLLSDIAELPPGSALKIPLAALPDSKENIRAALSRAGRLNNINLATSSNKEFLFVWEAPPKTSRENR